ncbi:MAG: phosphoserine phosphatase SerB, partial [Alphaproteobacteria bacterium]
MDLVLTCITLNVKLDDDFVQSMAAIAALQDTTVAGMDIEAGMARFILETTRDAQSLRNALQETMDRYAIDMILQPYPQPRYKLLISDMDSTMITCECIDELADFVGKKQQVSSITARAMNGELDFDAALTERVALLAGLDEAALEQCFLERVKPMPGAGALLAAHKAAGGYSVLVSGGFTFFTGRVARALGFDEHHGNRLEISGGKLTGRISPPILGKDAKLQTLHDSCQKLGISSEEVLAIGDGANDLPMLLAAGLGV